MKYVQVSAESTNTQFLSQISPPILDLDTKLQQQKVLDAMKEQEEEKRRDEETQQDMEEKIEEQNNSQEKGTSKDAEGKTGNKEERDETGKQSNEDKMKKEESGQLKSSKNRMSTLERRPKRSMGKRGKEEDRRGDRFSSQNLLTPFPT
ncbi:Hypothetical predicted protein [Xyrichtys novacula]|uniref:Uncharacterized protein n=1 Tax=Xyrichtys novacula TaxID=13765 RepID=A0AAV1H4Z2_XYRNO|nr:Hypothetical predicted protein [Xyrichtys novacula]